MAPPPPHLSPGLLPFIQPPHTSPINPEKHVELFSLYLSPMLSQGILPLLSTGILGAPISLGLPPNAHGERGRCRVMFSAILGQLILNEEPASLRGHFPNGRNTGGSRYTGPLYSIGGQSPNHRAPSSGPRLCLSREEDLPF